MIVLRRFYIYTSLVYMFKLRRYMQRDTLLQFMFLYKSFLFLSFPYLSSDFFIHTHIFYKHSLMQPSQPLQRFVNCDVMWVEKEDNIFLKIHKRITAEGWWLLFYIFYIVFFMCGSRHLLWWKQYNKIYCSFSRIR